MKYLYFILLLPSLIFSQNEITNSDIISEKNLFIKDYSNHLNIKLDVTNELFKYLIPFENKKATIRTNLNLSYGMVFSYKFISVRLGLRPKLSDKEQNNKGKTDHFRIRVKFLFNKWTHRLEYNYKRGFYIENTSDFNTDITNPDYNIQLPQLTTNIFFGSSIYKFNDNYSVKAIESNTEMQLKSAGTILAGIDYALYFIKGTDKYKLENEELIVRDNYNDFSGFVPILNVGYHYTFILHKFWYTNLYADPGIGFDFYKTKTYSSLETFTENNALEFFSLKTGLSAGYNGEKIYFGGEINFNLNSEKNGDNNANYQPIKNYYHLFFGYRFNAPKQVSEPVEYIEEKVPILKKDFN